MKTRLVVFLLIIAAFFACKTTKDVGSTASLENISLSDYFKSLLNNELQYNTLSYKMNVEVKMQSKSLSVKATLKMNKNEALQLSVQPLFGMETHRLTFTPDSVVFLDRLKKEYAAESITALMEKNPEFNFSMIQALFTNQLFAPGKEEITNSDKSLFEMKKYDDYVQLAAKDKGRLSFSFKGNADKYIQTSGISDNKGRVSMNWNYSDFKDFSNDVFPAKMNVNVQAKNKNMEAVFTISKIEKDKEQQISLSVPAKYKRIQWSGFSNLLQISN